MILTLSQPSVETAANGKPAPGFPGFPVPLVCPICRAHWTQEGVCPCLAGPRLENWRGLPRSLFDQPYWGECTQEKMHEVLNLLDAMPWREALGQVAGGVAVHEHLSNGIRADFIYAMPWREVQNGPGHGAGMGF